MKLVRLSIVAVAALGLSCNSVEDPAVMEGPQVKEHRSGEWSPELSDTESETLFRIANDTLDWGVKGGRERFDFTPYALTDKLREYAATFVTLKANGMLRGCIGSLEPVEELYMSVHHNALNASLRDPRFEPVSEQERERLEVHISILSPIVPIGDIDEFRIGEHGIILEKGRYRSVYLPEVALEQRWNVEQTLSSLSEKAGLPPEGWRDGARFSVFSSVVLSED